MPRRTAVILLAVVVWCGLSGLFPLAADAARASAGAAGPSVGQASYYSDKFHNKKTANGERYDKNALTAAHRTLPMGTVVRVTNLHNGRQVLLRINDRGPRKRSRIIDVSREGAERLGMVKRGVTDVKIEVLSDRRGHCQPENAFYVSLFSDASGAPRSGGSGQLPAGAAGAKHFMVRKAGGAARSFFVGFGPFASYRQAESVWEGVRRTVSSRGSHGAVVLCLPRARVQAASAAKTR